VFVPLATLMFVLAPDLIVFLFTPAYSASAPVLRVWCLMILLSIFQTDGVLRAFAQTPSLLALSFLKLGVVAASIPWLIGRLGLPGAALAAAVATAVAKAAALLPMKRRLDARWPEVLPWGALLATAAVAVAAGVPAALVRSRMEPASLALLVAATVAYAVAYVVFAGSLLLTAEERRAIHSWLQRKLGRPLVGELAPKG
jgi:O-antigen/teichoic acid export membrane protein